MLFVTLLILASRSSKMAQRALRSGLHLLRGPMLHALSYPNLSMRHSSYSCRVLGETTLLLQDGLDFHELPLVIRRLNATEFPFGSAIPGGEGHIQTTAQEERFAQQLQDCRNLRQVFSLLEVPGEQVTAYSAAFALQRLHQLHEGSTATPDSFIRQAIFHELCDTATADIQLLSPQTVIELVRCYLNSKNFNAVHRQLINEEVEKRIGDGSFSIAELCVLIQLLSENVHGSPGLTSVLWTHLGARYKEVDHSNISRVYGVLQNITSKHRYILKMMDKQSEHCWWKLSPDDVATMMRSVTLLNHENHGLLRRMGRWMFMTIHDVKDYHMRDILGAFIHFSFQDMHLIKAMERFIAAKKDRLNKSTVSITMEYCRRCRYLAPKIFDLVAKDFEHNHEHYDSDEIFYTLRTFGQMNYLPPNAKELFTEVEDMLLARFGEFPTHKILELLTSFVYIRRIPSNFIGQVFNPHFLTKVKGLPEHSLQIPAKMYLRQLYTAARLELPSHQPPYIDAGSLLGGVSSFMFGRWYFFHQNLGFNLVHCINQAYMKQAEIVKNTPYFVDYLVIVDHHDQREGKKSTKKCKIAVLTVMPEHTCANTGHLLGPYAMRKRHLDLLGYHVMEVRHSEFMWRLKSRRAKQEYLKDKLAKIHPYFDCETS